MTTRTYDHTADLNTVRELAAVIRESTKRKNALSEYMWTHDVDPDDVVAQLFDNNAPLTEYDIRAIWAVVNDANTAYHRMLFEVRDHEATPVDIVEAVKVHEDYLDAVRMTEEEDVNEATAVILDTDALTLAEEYAMSVWSSASDRAMELEERIEAGGDSDEVQEMLGNAYGRAAKAYRTAQHLRYLLATQKQEG